MGKIYVGQVGVLVSLDTGDTLTGATTTEIKYRTPTNIVGTWNAGVSGTSLTFTTTQATDLSFAGTYKLQAHAAGSGWDLLGETVDLEVYRAFE